MKFRVKIFENKWNGRRVTAGKQIKQKTFEAESWEEAEEIANKVWTEIEELRGCAGDMQLTRLVDTVKRCLTV